MQDYKIIVEYQGSTVKPKTSPQYVAPKQEKVSAEKPIVKEDNSNKLQLNGRKALAVGLATGMKINQYVGELTENRVTQRRVQVGLTFAGMAGLTVANPILGFVAIGSYVANAGINYGIRNYKENLSASYLRQLSGGTVNTGR